MANGKGVWALSLMLSLSAHAAQWPAGREFPPVQGHDITGQPRALSSYRGQKLLLVVMTHREASGQVSEWMKDAARRFPALPALALVSLRLPFFVKTDWVRARMKAQVPEAKWAHTWFDRHGQMKQVLGLSESQLPWVVVLDEHGRVLSGTQTPFSEQAAEAFWRSAGKSRPP